jgi:hypothetical protein
MTTPNFHVLIVKTLPATNTLPARVSIKSERFKQSVVISFNHDIDAVSPTIETAVAYLTGKGFEIMGKAEGSDHYYLITNTFEPIK